MGDEGATDATLWSRLAMALRVLFVSGVLLLYAVPDGAALSRAVAYVRWGRSHAEQQGELRRNDLIVAERPAEE